MWRAGALGSSPGPSPDQRSTHILASGALGAGESGRASRSLGRKRRRGPCGFPCISAMGSPRWAEGRGAPDRLREIPRWCVAVWLGLMKPGFEASAPGALTNPGAHGRPSAMQRCRRAQPGCLPNGKVGARTGDPAPPALHPQVHLTSGGLHSNSRGLLYVRSRPLLCKPASLRRTAPREPALYPSHTVPGGLCRRGVRKGPGSKHTASQQSRQERFPQRAVGCF